VVRIDLEGPVPATWSMLGLLVGVHAASGWTALGRLSLLEAYVWSRPAWLRIASGGQTAELVEAGQLWRLGTSVLVHADLLHLTFNLVSLYALGRLLEPWIGSVRLVGLFVIGGGLASVASQLAGVLQSDGASGGIFAMLGLAGAVVLRWRGRLAPDDATIVAPLWALTALNLVLSVVVPQIDAVAHFGGWLVGLGLGLPMRRPMGS